MIRLEPTGAIPPGSTIGILGGGQLGRMLAIAAAQLGYRTHVYAAEASGPATEVAAEWTQGAFDDEAALRAFAGKVDVVTYELESLDPVVIANLAAHVPVRPGALPLEMARYRPNEKALMTSIGGRTAAWQTVDSPRSLDDAIRSVGCPGILKTCLFGYDGKGQARIDTPEDAAAAWEAIGAPAPVPGGDPAIFESRVEFVAEFSLLLARGLDGQFAIWDVPENVHCDGILSTSTLPASALIRRHTPQAVALSKVVAERLGHVGVLATEWFVWEYGPVFNEMAPRVHNSGHWTIEGSVTSQFENHIRAICGLPLGSTALIGQRTTMENLIGEDVDRWPALLAEPGAHVHLYGKTARAGRKMGHVTRVER